MRATISSDTSRGPGFAVIEIFDANTGAEPTFILSRASDGKNLSPGGWQESENPLSPDAWDNDGGSLRLAVGPAVVDEIDSLDAYRLSLPGSGVCVLNVRGLVYSHIAGGQGIGGYTVPVPQPAPLVTVKVDVEPEPEPAAKQADADQGTTPPLRMATADAPPKRTAPWLAVTAVVVLGAATLAVWWFFLREPQDSQTPVPVPPVAEAPASSAKPIPASALGTAREHLRGNANPQESFSKGKALRTPEASPEESDAAFLLLEDAAQKNHPEAMFFVAQFYDPACPLPRGSIPTDLAQARHWYDQARQKGYAAAQAALDALRAQVQAKADTNDAQAKALLNDWK